MSEKVVFRVVMVQLIICMVWYGLMAFVTWSVNPAEWRAEERVMTVFLVLVASALIHPIIKNTTYFYNVEEES